MLSGVVEQTRSGEFDEDLILVDRFLAGDQDAFQALYQRHYDKVFAIAKGVLLDADEASDAVQEIFTLVFRKLDRFDRRSRFTTWLFRIAVNRSIQQARRLKHKKTQVELTEAIEQTADEEIRPVDDPAIQEAMRQLHPNDRAILTLFYWDELSLTEIAESLDCSANAAKTRLFRARERFRSIYEEVSRNEDSV